MALCGVLVSPGLARSAGTNPVTLFSVVKNHNYIQTSSGAPTFEYFGPFAFPYLFVGSVQLISNRTASVVTLTFPSGGVSNLVNSVGHPENFTLASPWAATSLAGFDAAFPPGNYQFNVASASSNQQVTLTLPSGMTQPNAPHIANFTAAQAVNPSLPFTLTWDSFQSPAGSDYISVVIGNTSFQKEEIGTATSTVIPAGTLAPLSSYPVTLGFYHANMTTNGLNYTLISRATTTKFTLITTNATSPPSPPVLSNPQWSKSGFSFDVSATIGQTITVAFRTNLLQASWQTLLVTNLTTNPARILDAGATANTARFYRAVISP